MEEVKMVKAIMHGCNGKMGQVISGLIKEDPQIEIINIHGKGYKLIVPDMD